MYACTLMLAQLLQMMRDALLVCLTFCCLYKHVCQAFCAQPANVLLTTVTPSAFDPRGCVCKVNNPYLYYEPNYTPQ